MAKANAKSDEAALIKRAVDLTLASIVAPDPAQSQVLAEAGGRALADAAGGVGCDRVLKADFDRVAQLHLTAVLERLETILLDAAPGLVGRETEDQVLRAWRDALAARSPVKN